MRPEKRFVNSEGKRFLSVYLQGSVRRVDGVERGFGLSGEVL